MIKNNRLESIYEYHFHKMDSIKKQLIVSGKEVYDFSIGDPDVPVNKDILNVLIDELYEIGFNKYPPYDGIKELKEEIINYYNKVYSVKLSLDEVIILIGSKEGVSNIIPAVCNFGDYVLIPKPAYPVYEACSKLWGAKVCNIKLSEQDEYLPNLGDIDKSVLSKIKLFIINYPNNPTGAVANKDFYKNIIKFSSDNNIVLVNDGAYNEVINEKDTPISLLQFDEKKNCIEFGTFSKIYSMTGFRIGFAVGNSAVIKSLLKIKSNVDSGQFIPIQKAAAQALKLPNEYINLCKKIYTERRIIAEELLLKRNISFFKGKGTFYIWCKTPKLYSSEEFCEELIKKYGIIFTPGKVFGGDENCFRISLTKDKQEIVKAFNKIHINN